MAKYKVDVANMAWEQVLVLSQQTMMAKYGSAYKATAGTIMTNALNYIKHKNTYINGVKYGSYTYQLPDDIYQGVYAEVTEKILAKYPQLQQTVDNQSNKKAKAKNW